MGHDVLGLEVCRPPPYYMSTGVIELITTIDRDSLTSTKYVGKICSCNRIALPSAEYSKLLQLVYGAWITSS
jgi:hypothetical protein